MEVFSASMPAVADFNIVRSAAGPGSAHETERAPILPRQPRSVCDTGLEPRLLTALVVKTMAVSGKASLSSLTGRLRLSISVVREVLQALVTEQQAEVAWCGESDIDVHYQLTAFGQRAAAGYLAESRYVGAAPVTLDAWRALVDQQSLRQPDCARVTPAELHALLADDGIDASVRKLLGAALYSNRPLMLHGPSGSGKTTLARKLARLCKEPVAVPYAVLVKHEIVQVYDPALHPVPLQLRALEDRRSGDARWALCQRPLVYTGAELACGMLELHADAGSGVLHAPPHLLANNGLLVLDDIGRQRIPAAEVLYRLLDALECGTDHVAMPGGTTHALPFDVSLVLATSLEPESVLDESCLRRIGYRIPVGPLSEPVYRALLRRQCLLRGIDADEAAIDYLVNELHRRTGRPLLAAWPHELLGRIADFAGFSGHAPRFDVDSVAQAWSSLFGVQAVFEPSNLGDAR